MNKVFMMPVVLMTLATLAIVPAHAQNNTITQTGTTPVGINSGFGGVVGGGTFTFTQTNPGDNNIKLKLTRGPGNLNDAVVIYIANGGAGFSSTSSFNDTGDGLRRAISGLDGGNRSTLNFGPGFSPTHAIAFNSGFSGLWQLTTGSHNFVASTNLALTGGAGNAATMFSMDFNMADLGLTPGASFDYVTTYISETAFRSDEFIGVDASHVPAGNIGYNTFSLAPGDNNKYVSVTAAIPEPTTLALLSLGVCGFVAKRRKK
jgi:PEP-CTERM motif